MGRLLSELKRRHVYRVAAAYVVLAWVLLQVVNNVAPVLDLPPWVARAFLLALVIGFPVAMFFAWIRELPSSDGATPYAATTRLDYVLAGALVVVIGLVTYQQLVSATGRGTTQQASLAPGPRSSEPGSVSIAVLPFANLSGDASQEFFSDGMTEEITAALAKVQGLTVLGRTSAFQFKGQNRDLREIGQMLGATHLIEGSVRKEGDRVRITAQLVQAANGANLWGESYDRQLTSVFVTQEDIARAIAGALRVPLGIQAGDTLVRNRTDNLETYEQYLRARELYRARGPSVPQAIRILEDIVTRDPAFAPAWGLLAQAYVQAPLGEVFFPVGIPPAVTESALNRAERAAREAIRLDAKNANGYGALADIQQRRGNWAEAEDIYRQAFAIDPNEPDVLGRYVAWLGNVGRIQDSATTSRKVQALDPLVARNTYNAAMDLQSLGQYNDSIPVLEEMPSGTVPTDQRNRSLAQAYAGMGQYAKAADLLRASKGDVYSRQSIEDAARLLRAAPARAAEPLPELEGQLRFVYAYVGAAERDLEGVERQIASRYIFMLSSLWNPQYASMRKTERFKRLVRTAGLVDYWRARGWPDLCRPVGADDFVCD